MSNKFQDFLRGIRPPPDGRYEWSIAEFERNPWGLLLTLTVTGGEFQGRKFTTQLRFAKDANQIEQLLTAIEAETANSERDLKGRTLFATKATSGGGYAYLRMISAAELPTVDASAGDDQDD